MESYSLFQLNEYIRRVIALNFREPIWIEAEVIQCNDSKGNIYIELAEKDEKSNEVVAQASAAIWYNNFQFIKRKLGDVVYQLLKDGTQIRVKCRVDFNERFGFKLFIEDIDPNFTFGQLELRRQRILSRLQEEGLMELNSSLILPKVIQIVAVISSSAAAGYQDFINQLRDNSYGYQFHIDLYEAAVQGVKVESETCRAIELIHKNGKDYHAVIILRGGGSKLDLAAYDNYEIAKAIATSDIPFIIGIGHDIDNTITDLVSCLSVKTPTAVADYLIETNLLYESKLEYYGQTIFQKALMLTNKENSFLNSYQDKIELLSRQMIALEHAHLFQLEGSVKQNAQNLIERQFEYLDRLEQTIVHLDPKLVLQRGYAYILKNDKLIQSIKNIKLDDELDINLGDGSFNAKVI